MIVGGLVGIAIGICIDHIVDKKNNKCSNNEHALILELNDHKEIQIMHYNNPINVIHSENCEYLGYFYTWKEFRNYINTHEPHKYVNKVFSISLNNKYHYYLITSPYVIEEVTLVKGDKK